MQLIPDIEEGGGQLSITKYYEVVEESKTSIFVIRNVVSAVYWGVCGGGGGGRNHLILC